MEKIEKFMTKGGEVADAFCTSPNELIIWVVVATLVGVGVGFLSARILMKR